MEDPGTPIYPDPPHWSDSNLNGVIDGEEERALPVGYPRNTDSFVSAKFAATLVNLPYPPANYGLMVRGFNILSAYQPYFYTVPPTAAFLQGNDVYLPPTLIHNPFPNTVNYGTLVINWEFSYDGGAGWTQAGRSENELYVTLATPTVSPVYHTPIHLSVSSAALVAASDEDAVVCETLYMFKTLRVRAFGKNDRFGMKAAAL